MIDTPSVDWAGLSPYLALLGGASAVLLGAVFVKGPRRNAFGAAVAALALLGAGAAAVVLFTLDDEGTGIIADAIRRDRLADLATVILAGVGLLAVLVSYREQNADERRGEYYALLLSAVGGMAFLVAANDLISLFLGLEWFSISLYILCAVTAARTASLEASLKYLVIGGFSSAVLLFGSALVFGATGEIGFADIGAQADTGDRLLLVAGLAMIVAGLGFKVSAAPFHMWTPDVYEGAPTPVTAFMAAATKAAALVLTLRFLTTAFPGEAELWTITLGVLATISLAWGNLGALVQKNVKRLLAYSSISHAGFLLMPVAAGNELGGQALLYYLIPYAALSVGAFAVAATRERELGQPATVENLAGFGWERPFHGAAMAVFMIGFIGLPPTGIFLGKFYAFSALYDRGWIWLMVIGAVFTAVSIAYYLGVVRSLYARPKLAAMPAGGSPPKDRLLDLAVALALVVGVGSFFAADPLIDVITDAVEFLPYPF
jgi:NADH-quinone oxidoreductase subunit N